jgi:hypothetical protein
MAERASELAERLAQNAESVCRHYLSNGRRQGAYWQVGNVANEPGRSLFVRLRGPLRGKGAAGKWTDAATGDHGDLLDLIARARGLQNFRDVLDEARAFLSLPQWQHHFPSRPAPHGSPESARRLFAASKPIDATLAATYLRSRGIVELRNLQALRFHPTCFFRDDDERAKAWPAMIAAVTDCARLLTGVHRTWLDHCGTRKAPIATPRRALGHLLGNAVRFGTAHDVLAAGEGIETMLSLRSALPGLPMAAALSANHLAALVLPSTVRTLYIARDSDPAGDIAVATLTNRAQCASIEARTLSPLGGDFNDDLRAIGLQGLRAHLRVQLAPEHVTRFLDWHDAG